MKVTFVVGATASGKSALALKLAQTHKGVIVNCDSVQVYSQIQIGAAKPTDEDFQKVPHYLYGHVNPPSDYTAGEYRRDFFDQLKKLEQQNVRDVFVVGGTGFYFQAIEKGMYSIEKAQPLLTQELELLAATPEGLLELYRELKKFDPLSALKIHPNDQYRIVRAIEIIRVTGRKPSDLKQEKQEQTAAFPYALTKIGVQWERSQLHERIHQRVKKMLSSGLIDEVKALNKLNLQSWAPLRSVGYAEVQDYLSGKITSKSALEERILISTRQLAKRQITWFKRDSEIHWINN